MEKLTVLWKDFFKKKSVENNWWKRKLDLWERQKGDIVQVKGSGIPYTQFRYDNKNMQTYKLHLAFLIKQDKSFHIEEQILNYQLEIEKDKIINHKPLRYKSFPVSTEIPVEKNLTASSPSRFSYDRREAVHYAERWWNSYNPEFRAFDVDCTNYISQCLLAGGAPMRGAPNREAGWWYQHDNWSFSWAVAHSMRWYLSGSTEGLQASETENPEDLLPGDVICYDFEGDGSWDHTTIVVRYDAYGMPLVNAHTDNSRNRYWTYEDSAAWTPNIQYKFFRIGV